MSTELLRGHLDSLVLAVLDHAPAHGYAVIERLREGSEGAFDLPDGTVYPALHRLEEAGLVKSSRDTVNGRKRRVYRITPRGIKALADGKESWRVFATAVTSVLKLSPWPAK